jgi:hypothetical protein
MDNLVQGQGVLVRFMEHTVDLLWMVINAQVVSYALFSVVGSLGDVGLVWLLYLLGWESVA